MRMDDGFSTTITFSEDSEVVLYEKNVTPPGVDGGGEIDTTTMRNAIWRTKQPKKLINLSPASLTVAYDTDAYDNITGMINTNQEITVTFPDDATLVFWGWINTFMPGEITEGEQPTAEVEIIPSNHDDDGVETAPVFTPAS